MKKLLYLLTFVLLMTACAINKKPIFVKLDNLKITSVSSDTIQLVATAFFENPNDVGGKISTDDIKILVNNIEVAEVFSNDFKVPARDEFTIPLLAKIPTKKLLNTNSNSVLGSLINSLITNKVKVRIKGNLEYVVFGFKKDFLVDKTQEIKIKF